MIVYIDDIFDKDFIENYIPFVILSRIKSVAKKKNLNHINEFLKRNYSITVDDVLNAIEFSINKYSKVYSIIINNNIIEQKSKEKVISLVKLIEYGNLEVKGTNLINSSFLYIKNHLNEIYMSYIVKGGR